MSLIRRTFLFLFLIYISGFPVRMELISQLTNEMLLVFFSVTGMLSFCLYLAKRNYKIEIIDAIILILVIIFPLLSSITSRIIADQPVYMGYLSFRGTFLILTYYSFIILNIEKKDLFNDLTIVVTTLIVLVALLFFIFNVNDFTVPYNKGSFEVKMGMTTTKSLQFTGYTSLFMIAYVIALVRYFETRNLKHLLIPVMIFIVSTFISKGRIEILVYSLLPVIMYFFRYRESQVNLFFYTVFLIILISTVILTDNPLSRNFGALLKFTDLDFARRTGDFSAYIRAQEYETAMKWFIKYPLSGVGNLSYRYNDGFVGFTSGHFFISDIGVFGVLIKGGVILLFLYILFYVRLYTGFNNHSVISNIGKYLFFDLTLKLFLGVDYFFFYPGLVTILLYIRYLSINYHLVIKTE